LSSLARFPARWNHLAEIAFLLSRPATATVTLEPGCHYCVWDSKTLHAVLNGNPALRTSMSAAMNRKLAEKVAQAGVLTDLIGDTLEAPKAKGIAPRTIKRAKKSKRSLQKA
jgi:CRP-like cAMP-binding protein